MSIDKMQDKIRKLKNPSMISWILNPDQVPANTRTGDDLGDWHHYCKTVMNGLKGLVPAMRFDFASFAVRGAAGVELLTSVLKDAGQMGYYVLLDAPEVLSAASAELVAAGILGENSQFPCDGVVLSTYLGSDVLKPFLSYCGGKEKDLFCVVRTGNRSAAELQDLLTGTRLVHHVAADMVNRCGKDYFGQTKYSRVAALASAGSAESLRSLRSKFPNLFLLVDGYDYPGANAKNCSQAFDKFGHGAAVCAADSVTAAWRQTESDGSDYLELAVAAAERMKKNLTRYLTIL